jgi:hypothetical protein
MLTGWKVIAAYLNVSLRTAKKYANHHGMPVHRLPGGTAAILLSDLQACLQKKKK